MKIEGLPEAVAATASTTHVVPIKFNESDDPPGFEIGEAYVDVFGNLIVRSRNADKETFVLIGLEHWGTLDKLARFAKKHQPKRGE